MTRAAALLWALAVVPALSGASVVTHARYAMGTVCEVGVPSKDAKLIDAAFAEAERIESMLSTWTEESELARVNRGEASPSPELQALLDETLEWSRRTNRAFDPRVKALIDVWKTREEGTIPSPAAIADAMQQTHLEEGAFGKGYAIDRMLALLPAEGSAINFGGQLAVRGVHRVGVADPADRAHPVLSLELRNESISTSSGSEKTFTVAGRQFSHILDPRTGQALPPRGSVSVIAAKALTADILSTALYVMGEDDGLRWADANGVAAIFITSHRKIRLSAAAREHVRGLELTDRKFTLKE
jgi:thiamine biosynthesis lipoprotein